jgi:hypothetical protein
MIEITYESPGIEDSVQKKRVDYTFKFNRHFGRHGWLRLTPAYSVKLVEEILNETKPNSCILDPFSGTATTPLCAGQLGYPAVGLEINPFLVWFGRVKTDIYSLEEIKKTEENSNVLLDMISANDVTPSAPPSIHNITRWWNEDELDYLCKLKAAIEKLCPGSSKSKNLLLVAFCRLLITLSNAAFNHQSMSFGERKQCRLHLFNPVDKFNLIFQAELRKVLNSVMHNPIIKPQITRCDSRFIDCSIMETFDCIITSPPYPNRMSYIRELRPYMYWLGYLINGREAGELDWQSIGGTWGIATSRLNDWQQSKGSYCPPYLKDLLAKVAHADNKNGQIMASYIARYFEDIWFHLRSAVDKISKGACVHYIIGNSMFYQILIPVELLYKDIMERVGISEVKIRKIRKRNSKKALFEFDVSGVKH